MNMTALIISRAVIHCMQCIVFCEPQFKNRYVQQTSLSNSSTQQASVDNEQLPLSAVIERYW